MHIYNTPIYIFRCFRRVIVLLVNDDAVCILVYYGYRNRTTEIEFRIENSHATTLEIRIEKFVFKNYGRHLYKV